MPTQNASLTAALLNLRFDASLCAIQASIHPVSQNPTPAGVQGSSRLICLLATAFGAQYMNCHMQPSMQQMVADSPLSPPARKVASSVPAARRTAAGSWEWQSCSRAFQRKAG